MKNQNISSLFRLLLIVSTLIVLNTGCATFRKSGPVKDQEYLFGFKSKEKSQTITSKEIVSDLLRRDFTSSYDLSVLPISTAVSNQLETEQKEKLGEKLPLKKEEESPKDLCFMVSLKGKTKDSATFDYWGFSYVDAKGTTSNLQSKIRSGNRSPRKTTTIVSSTYYYSAGTALIPSTSTYTVDEYSAEDILCLSDEDFEKTGFNFSLPMTVVSKPRFEKDLDASIVSWN